MCVCKCLWWMILRVLFPNKICQISRSDILFLLTASVAVQTGIPEAILTTYVAVQLHHTTLLAKRDETALTTDVADHRPHTTLLADTDSNSNDNRCGCSTSSHHTASRHRFQQHWQQMWLFNFITPHCYQTDSSSTDNRCGCLSSSDHKTKGPNPLLDSVVWLGKTSDIWYWYLMTCVTHLDSVWWKCENDRPADTGTNEEHYSNIFFLELRKIQRITDTNIVIICGMVSTKMQRKVCNILCSK